MSATLLVHPVVPVGVVKSFSPYGPEYKILGSAPTQEGKAGVRILLVRTGEETDYSLEAALSDPEAS